MKLVAYALLIAVTLLSVLANTTAMSQMRVAVDTALYYALYDAASAGLEAAQDRINEELYAWPVLHEQAAAQALRDSLAAAAIPSVCYREYDSSNWQTSPECPVLVDYRVFPTVGPERPVRDPVTGETFKPPYEAVLSYQSLLGKRYERPAVEAVLTVRVQLPVSLGLVPYVDVTVRKSQEAWLPGSVTAVD